MALIPKFNEEIVNDWSGFVREIFQNAKLNPSAFSNLMQLAQDEIISRHNLKINVIRPYEIYYIDRYLIKDIVGYILDMCVPEKNHTHCQKCDTRIPCDDHCWCSITAVCKKWYVLSKRIILKRQRVLYNQPLRGFVTAIAHSRILTAAELQSFHRAGSRPESFCQKCRPRKKLDYEKIRNDVIRMNSLAGLRRLID